MFGYRRLSRRIESLEGRVAEVAEMAEKAKSRSRLFVTTNNTWSGYDWIGVDAVVKEILDELNMDVKIVPENSIPKSAKLVAKVEK